MRGWFEIRAINGRIGGVRLQEKGGAEEDALLIHVLFMGGGMSFVLCLRQTLNIVAKFMTCAFRAALSAVRV